MKKRQLNLVNVNSELSSLNTDGGFLNFHTLTRQKFIVILLFLDT